MQITDRMVAAETALRGTMMTDLTTLIAMLEEATGPDRELDAEIAESLGFPVEWRQANYTMDLYPVIHWMETREPCPQFTASADAAIALAERVLPPAWIRLDHWFMGEAKPAVAAILPKPTPNETYGGKAANLAIALTIAVLRAVEAQKGENNADH